MTGQRKTKSREKALRKFNNSGNYFLNRVDFFNVGFNMGWKSGKKRQRQLFYNRFSDNEITLGRMNAISFLNKISMEVFNDWINILNDKPKDKIVFNKEKKCWSLK